MFSSKELISFVFANENDTYYGDDLLKLDLNQYLWERLHGSYEAVYFLSAEENTFHIRSYGDQCCKEYVPAKKKLFSLGGKTEQREQGNWILQQLRRKSGEAAAFVCPLEDFCAVLSDSRWDAVLEDMAGEKNRTGIFVLTASTTAEKTSALLLESPVFEKLRETAVTDLRAGALRELYSTLKKRKWDNCMFLNIFTWERIRALLMHLVMAYPDRCESCAQLDSLADYLYAYLRDPAIAGEERLLPEDMPAGYLMYETLYEQLEKEYIWRKLLKQSACYAGGACRDRWENSGTEVPVLRDRNSYAGRCMKIHVPKWAREDEAAGPKIRQKLNSICCQVSAPKNRPENQAIITAAEDLLSQIDAVHACDTDTYVRVLQALEFCVCQVYLAVEDEKTESVLTIIKKQQEAIRFSGDCFILRRELELNRSYSIGGKLQSMALQRMESRLYTTEQIIRKHDDLIVAMEMELKMPAGTGNIAEQLAELERAIENLQHQETIPEPESEPEVVLTPADIPDPEPEPEPEDFPLTPDLYSIKPP